MIQEYWDIGIIKRPISSVISAERGLIDDVYWLPATHASTAFRADPCGFVRDNTPYVIYEHYDYNDEKPKGELRILELDEKLNIRRENVFLRKEHHISYPYLFEHDGHVYMSPETYQNGRISFYRVNLDTMQPEEVLTSSNTVQGIDPTLFYYNGYWWMFFGDFRLSPNKNLFLAYTEDIFRGPWKLHANCDFLTPLISNFSGSRMAGSVVQHEGCLYRMGQHCVDGYGRAVCVFRILNLSPFKYEEELVNIVRPNGPSFERYNMGLHHISPLGEWTLIDAKRHASPCAY
jgi:hypothetical protein